MYVFLHTVDRKFKQLCDILDELSRNEEIVLCKAEIHNYDDTIYIRKKPPALKEQTVFVVTREKIGNSYSDPYCESPAMSLTKSFEMLNSDTFIQVKKSLLVGGIHHEFIFDILPNGGRYSS